MVNRRLFPRYGLTVVLATALGILACNESEPTNPAGPQVFAAKGGGGGPPPKVKQAVPDMAPQETTLDVRVIGSGFDNGSVAKFLLVGQSTPKVVVNSSTFVDGNNLIANVTIALDADVALYDIAVTTTRGKKGIGSELFAVTLKGGGGCEDGNPPPCGDDGDGGGARSATLDLADGMVVTGLALPQLKENKKQITTFTNTVPPITMMFENADECVGINTRNGDPTTPEQVDSLKLELISQQNSVFHFNMEIYNLTSTPEPAGLLAVSFMGTMSETTVLKMFTVAQVNDSVFAFTGRLRLFAARGTVGRDSPRILCDGDNLVTVTLHR